MACRAQVQTSLDLPGKRTWRRGAGARLLGEENLPVYHSILFRAAVQPPTAQHITCIR